MADTSSLLGDFSWPSQPSSALQEKMKVFSSPSFLEASQWQRFLSINATLLLIIKETPPPAFLLPTVIEFIDHVNTRKLLNDRYHITSFEFWLNEFSDCTESENQAVRGKIMGKGLPREAYQSLFPIGMGKKFFGTHFVAAHLAPDVDTTVASFWGWIDSFAARVGTGLHRWSLPGGAPETPFTKIFCELFGNSVFGSLARTDTTLTLSSLDLLTQKGISKASPETFTPTLQHQKGTEAILLVNKHNHFVGDWRSADLERVRPVVIAFKSLLHWFEYSVIEGLISLFSQENVHLTDIRAFASDVFEKQLGACAPATEFTGEQRESLDAFFTTVLNMPKGLRATFTDFCQTLTKLSVDEIIQFEKEMKLFSSTLFDGEGTLKENRPLLFQQLKKLIERLDQTVHWLRNFVERLDIMVQIKQDVLHTAIPTLTLDSDVEEIRLKMENLDYLLTLVKTEEGQIPVGIVRQSDLRQEMLGTVSFRDFCNTEEVKMASYLQVISVMDHHKTSLYTQSTPMARISDAQSCNVLLAEEAFALNDTYSVGGMSREAIDEQLRAHQDDSSSTALRLTSRLLKKKEALEKQSYAYVDPHREYLEYYCFLQAILDDTDLLTKVSNRDVHCVMELLNRMKSLSLRKETELINDSDLPRDQHYARALAKRILKNEEMYSIYRKIYSYKEKETQDHFLLCEKGDFSNLFADVKEQNSFARISQTKIFSSNADAFHQAAHAMRLHWIQASAKRHNVRAEIDLYLHMISTIPSAQDVYEEKIAETTHQDELWFWIPPTQQALYHLIGFLSAFQFAPEIVDNDLSLELLGPQAKELAQAFERNFRPISVKILEEWEGEHSMAILRFRAGSLNSRKAMVSPYLPRIVP